MALKFLPPAAWAQGAGAFGSRERVAFNRQALERFKRGARAASALRNPKIVTIRDIDEADGVHFIAIKIVQVRLGLLRDAYQSAGLICARDAKGECMSQGLFNRAREAHAPLRTLDVQSS